MRLHALAALASLIFAAAPIANAAPPLDDPAADARILRACVASAGNLEPACIGRVADACLKTADSEQRMGDCETRELRIWDGWLNRDYPVVMAAQTPKARVVLRTIERAFVADTARRCDFIITINGPTHVNIPPIQECRLRATATQWLWLKEFMPGSSAGPV